jgi:EAL domain-containing protein (putative c-di-GMP-specific phosphodiesterase class I)
VFTQATADLPSAVRGETLQARLDRAMAEDRLVLHLQPVLDVPLGRVVAAETLLRIFEDGRLVGPAEFIEAAEQSELIITLDSHILRRGIALVPRLRERDPDFRLAINVSARSIGDPLLEQTIVESLARHGVPGSALILEVTETAAMSEIEHAQAFAQKMRELGCSLALDDFGHAFGTFARLKRMTFDYIKIYGEFVTAAGESEIDCAVLRSIIRVAHDLDKRVVAEHVADQSTFDLVVREGADLVQGFHIARPMPIEDFLDQCLPQPARRNR